MAERCTPSAHRACSVSDVPSSAPSRIETRADRLFASSAATGPQPQWPGGALDRSRCPTRHADQPDAPRSLRFERSRGYLRGHCVLALQQGRRGKRAACRLVGACSAARVHPRAGAQRSAPRGQTTGQAARYAGGRQPGLVAPRCLLRCREQCLRQPGHRQWAAVKHRCHEQVVALEERGHLDTQQMTCTQCTGKFWRGDLQTGLHKDLYVRVELRTLRLAHRACTLRKEHRPLNRVHTTVQIIGQRLHDLLDVRTRPRARPRPERHLQRLWGRPSRPQCQGNTPRAARRRRPPVQCDSPPGDLTLTERIVRSRCNAEHQRGVTHIARDWSERGQSRPGAGYTGRHEIKRGLKAYDATPARRHESTRRRRWPATTDPCRARPQPTSRRCHPASRADPIAGNASERRVRHNLVAVFRCRRFSEQQCTGAAQARNRRRIATLQCVRQ